ncbi:MAG: MFS transporter [Chloroflexota bacterium]|jgi:GPH family glycoside/pentoside/hexuronide:cation symporter
MDHALRVPTRRESWLYAIANLGGSIPYQAFGAVVLFYYTDVKQLSPAVAALIMSIYAIWNAVNNPIIGHISDRTNTKWGRRLPYIRFGAIPYAIAFALIWLAPFDGKTQPTELAIWFLVTIILFEGLGTAVSMAGHLALLPEMFPTYKSRLDVAVRMNWIQTTGLFVGAALPPILASILGYPLMGIVFAVVACSAYFIGLQGMFEQPNYQPTPIKFVDAVKHTVVNRSFVSVMMAQMMRFVATNTLTSGMFFYVKYSLNADPAQTTIILATAFVAAGLYLPIWRKFIAQPFGPRTSLMIAYASIGLAVIPLYFVQEFNHALITAAIIGFPVAGLIMLGDVIMSDVIDEDEMRNGSRREAMFFAVNGAAVAMSSTIAATGFGIISTMYGYNPVLESQPDTVDQGFRVYMIVLPIIGAICAVTALSFYPLHGQRLRDIRAFAKRD